MDMKAKIKKFFKDYADHIAVDDEIVKGWFQNEQDFNFSNAEVYHFLSSVAYFCKRNKKVLSIDWPKVEKRFNIKKKVEK